VRGDFSFFSTSPSACVTPTAVANGERASFVLSPNIGQTGAGLYEATRPRGLTEQDENIVYIGSGTPEVDVRGTVGCSFESNSLDIRCGYSGSDPSNFDRFLTDAELDAIIAEGPFSRITLHQFNP
jgi:hypothetical protein